MEKAAAKKEYKQAKRPMGVYGITNTKNNKLYLGFGTDLQAKINRHKAELRFRSHRSSELQEEWGSFGESAFQFEVLDELDQEKKPQARPTEELPVLAEMWIRKLEKKGYCVVSL
jgi:hypothetical protein